MDNICSKELKDAIRKENSGIQLVLPHLHRAIKAERAIQTFKNHSKAGLASVDLNFSVKEWDRIMSQAVLTVNLLRKLRINPVLSAWAYLFSQFDWMKTPLAPPGKNVLVHLKPDARSSWLPNG